MSIIRLLNKKINRLLFTTPSHSGVNIFSPYKEYYGHDYSEIEGFDDLSNPKGEILKSILKTSQIYASKRTFYLTNGSTSAILSALNALCKEGDKVVVSRNCHKSVYHSLVLSNLEPLWAEPQRIEEWGIYGAADLFNIEEKLKENNVKAIVITSPTYEGIVSDIEALSMLCDKYGAYLIVDEAHGALYNFSDKLPAPAIKCGADISFNSLHKTAGALNPAALMHLSRKNEIEVDKIQNALNLITTTSPSYPLLANIEACVDFLNTKGQKEIEILLNNIEKFIEGATKAGFEIFKNNDPTKILIKGGYSLSSKLFNDFNIEDEMSNAKSTLFICGIGTTQKKLNELLKVLKTLRPDEFEGGQNFYPPEAIVKVKPKEAYNSDFEYVDALDCVGRICADIIAPYPPGIGVLYPGEVIQEGHSPYLSGFIKVMREVK